MQKGKTVKDRPTSNPPSVKVAREKAAGLTNSTGILAGALTDWAGIAALTYLIAHDKAPMEPWGWVIVGLATGTIINKIRGKAAGSTTALVVTVATKFGVGGILKGLL